MKSTVLFEAGQKAFALPPQVVADMQAVRARIVSASQIVWGEHCSECAFPSCYSSCAFYAPRADLHCRRFDKGIEQGVAGPGLDLMQIQFRRWGKLEGQGPVPLKSLAARARHDAKDRSVSAFAQAPIVPRRLSQGLIATWNHRKQDSAAAAADISYADVQFVIETYLAPEHHNAPIPFTLTLIDAAKIADSLFQQAFEIAPGYQRAVFSARDMARHVALDQPFLIQIEPVGDAPPVPIVFGLAEFVTAAPDVALALKPGGGTPKKSRTAKCVVWDLDDTLWHGTLAEDGLEGLRLKPEAVDLIHTLDARGILMSVASKNDPEPALAALKTFGLRDYFLFPQIGWGPKSVSIRQIAETLDIGADTFVFLDDQPFERAEVLQNVPGVTVMDAARVPELGQHALFDVPATPEAAKRRSMYQTEETRAATFQASGAEYTDFLRDCRIELKLDVLHAGNLERIYELTQRTNQLNFSGARHDRAELSALIGQPGRTHVLACSDKFGDYGIIGFVIAAPDRFEIESYFMSCRVQRKRVEQAFFAHLIRVWGEPATLTARYRQTEKNAASVRLLESLGFVRAGDVFVRQAGTPIAYADIVKLVHAAPVEARS